MAYRYSTCARFLSLVAALPWSAFSIEARNGDDAPMGATPAVLAASDSAAVITTVLADRKPIAKGERIGLNGPAPPVAVRAPIGAPRLDSSGGVDALQLAHANHPSRAFLCRFLI